MERIVSLCKRRGFVFPTAEKYGGLQGFWDWGPLGVELKNNIKREWWRHFVQERRDVVGLDSAIITNPKVWEKSGHISGFTDELIECKICNQRFKSDSVAIEQHLVDEVINRYKTAKKKKELLQKAKEQLMEQGLYKESYTFRKQYIEVLLKIDRSQDEALFDEVTKILGDEGIYNKIFTDSRKFNTMFKTFVGPVEQSSSTAFLRPETAQNIFVNYETIVQTSRMKPPFGIAQIGKAFRNEITPGNFIFRSREFEQMELEFFVPPVEDEKWFQYWTDEALHWFVQHGVKKEHLRRYEQTKEELAHYAKATTDIEFRWPFDKGWGELTGVANRTDFDLKAHGMAKDVPFVIEPSFGVERAALAFLLDAYDEVKGGRTTTTESSKESEVVLRLHYSLAPIKVAILPLSKKEPLQKVAEDMFQTLKHSFMCAYDDIASIGRRYRRQDEIGTPFCVTVDFESLEDHKVTVRDRDTMEQERIAIDLLPGYLQKQLSTE
ncbi:MAG: glycine--tRNA ligase [bacterium]